MRDKRAYDEMRPVEIIEGYSEFAEGSVLISFGKTKILCNASVEEKVPFFIKEQNEESGWVTGEYNMLPRSTPVRTSRERSKIGGRTHEIQRLIGRSLRSVMDLKALGARTITLDCDVLQADGGTRTAAISGSFVALVLALKKMKDQGFIDHIPVSNYIAAVSVGKYRGSYLLDLDYEEDSQAEVDMNVVMTDQGDFIELQGTGEAYPFGEEDFKSMLLLAKKGIRGIMEHQRMILNSVMP